MGRLHGAKLAAQRGDLRHPLPVGFVYDYDHTVVKDPDEQVQRAVTGLFAEFGRTGLTLGVVRAFAEVYGPRSALDLHYSMVARKSEYPHNAPDAIRTRDDFVHLINGFDGTIMYWDTLFGELLETLDELGIAGETAIIVSADHGESFGEHGSYGEHGHASEPVNRVPLVVYWPGVTDSLPDEARHCDSLLYNIDYAPTLCDLLGIAAPSGWQGSSFADAVRGHAIGSREYLVLGQGAHTYQRAVRTRDHMYIRTYHPGAFKVEWEELFDVKETYGCTPSQVRAMAGLPDNRSEPSLRRTG